MSREQTLLTIHDAFVETPYPGDAFLQGSFEGDEPFTEVGAFVGLRVWTAIEAAFLDEHYSAMSFFSEAGLRFFLPAYLCADVRAELQTADPLFGLIHGFSTTEYPAHAPDGSMTVRRTGGETILNPLRYGAMTWEDASRHRLSVFCREEAVGIVAYLEWRRGRDDLLDEATRIDAALDRFWRERAASAPARSDLI
jgi:hypothetical protein